MSDRTVEDESELYDEAYYQRGCGPLPYDRSIPHWANFFGKIADELIRTFRVRRVFDAGCAMGFLVEALWDRGVTTLGRDVSRYAISQVRPDVRDFCAVGSLTEAIEGRYDLVVCIEVVEHMPEDEALAAIAHMTAAADIVVLSSSPSDFDEPTHVNVRPPIYWMQALAKHSFSPLVETTLYSITPYALAFQRQSSPPSEEFLAACAEVVRCRIKQSEDALRVHELSVALNKRTADANEIARLKADADSADAALTGLSERFGMLSAERDSFASSLASSDELGRQLREFAGNLLSINTNLHALVSQIRGSRFLRVRRKLLQIFDRLGRTRNWDDPLDRLVEVARTGGLLGFDPVYYCERYPDVVQSGFDPLDHFIRYGRAEGRTPSRTLSLGLRTIEPSSATLRLSDLCNPEHDEAGPKVSDDAFRVSVLTPTYNIAPRYIRELYQTLVNQTYSNWEWIVVDDGSTATGAIAVLREIAQRDARVTFLCSPANLGISGASNLGLAQARGNYVALVDHDDLLARDALLEIYKLWKTCPETQIFFTDEAKLQPDGSITNLWAKPDWSPAYLECTMCIGHLSLYRRDFIDALGGFRSEYDGTQDFDLALRALALNAKVVHAPIFAYLWRVIPGSAAAGAEEKPYAFERQRRAVLDYARQRHADAEVAVAGQKGYWRIQYPLPSPHPLLSYVIPAGGGVRAIRGAEVELVVNCVRSFQDKNFYPNCEYVVVHNGTLSKQQQNKLLALPGVRLVVHADPAFNFSRTVNAGVAASRGEYICLLNDDVEAITDRGGEKMVSYLAANPDVALMGPKCLFEDNLIQQCGVVLLPHAGPAHAATGMPRDFSGHHMALGCRREVYCVGAAMLIARKSAYEEIGGFDEELPLNYNDVDFSLRIRERGYRCVIDPDVEVYHFESATKLGTARVEQERMFLGRADMRDPYFSKWFDPTNPSYVLNLKAPDELLPFGSWLDRYIARRAARRPVPPALGVTICLLSNDQPAHILDEAARSAAMQTVPARLILADCGVREEEARRWFDRASANGVSTLPRANSLGELASALLAASDDDFFVFLAAADFLSVDALQLLSSAVEASPDAQLFYADNYEATADSTRRNPAFKPDFDPLLLLNCSYFDPFIAVRRDLLEKVARQEANSPLESLSALLVVHALLAGSEPRHLRELIGARRTTYPSIPRAQGDKMRHLTVQRLIEAGAAAATLTVTSGPDGRSRLVSATPVSGCEVLDANQLWRNEAEGIDRLRSISSTGSCEWIAIVLNGDRDAILGELSAAPLFEQRINVSSGVILDNAGTLRWSGGVFLPGGRLFDPNAGRVVDDCVYPELAASQRCVDIAAPINVLIRVAALTRVFESFHIVDADGLMVALGVDAVERGEYVCVIPHIRTIIRPGLPSACADRRGLALGRPSLNVGSRWYDGRLGVEHPYDFRGLG